MKIIWWETLAIVMIPLLIILIFSLCRLYLTQSIKPTCQWASIKDNLQTGDLLFVHYQSKHSKIIKIFTGSDWGHTSFVYRQGNEIFLIEVTDYRGYTSIPNVEHLSGLCMIPLKLWIELNEERLCGYRKCALRIPNEKVQDVIDQYRGITLDMDLYNWSFSLFNTRNRNLVKTNYFCSEFIALLLQKLALLDSEYDPASYSPLKLSMIKNYHPIDTFYLF